MHRGSFGGPPLGAARYTFTDRRGGVSEAPYAALNLGGLVGDDPAAVAANRKTLAAGLGFPPERVLYMRQVHGNHVVVVDGPWPGEPPEADALVTASRGLALVALVADCVPVLLAESRAGVVAAVHAGRRGVQGGVVARALAAMADLGADLTRVEARLGPAICGPCYEVPADMQAEVLDRVPGARATTPRGTPALDLRAGLTWQLETVGVAVESVGPCTAESPQHFSYRRDGTTGRAAGLVWLPEAIDL